jgi:hypothetical protein
MSKSEVKQLFINGAILKKESIMKFKNNKIVRGSFNEYYLGEQKITESQFNYLYENFKCERINKELLRETHYKYLSE